MPLSCTFSSGSSRLTQLLAAGLLALAGGGLQAAPASAPPDVPTLIDSDTLEYDDPRQTSVFSGNVVLTRGDLSMRAHRLELRQDDTGAQFAIATAGRDNQVYVRQAKPGSVEIVEGYADRAEYDSRSETLEFIGHAVVTRLACGIKLDEIRGERIRYNQGSDVYTATGGPKAGTANQRVRTMIQSRETSQRAITSCPGTTPAEGR